MIIRLHYTTKNKVLYTLHSAYRKLELIWPSYFPYLWSLSLSVQQAQCWYICLWSPNSHSRLNFAYSMYVSTYIVICTGVFGSSAAEDWVATIGSLSGILHHSFIWAVGIIWSFVIPKMLDSPSLCCESCLGRKDFSCHWSGCYGGQGVVK